MKCTRCLKEIREGEQVVHLKYDTETFQYSVAKKETIGTESFIYAFGYRCAKLALQENRLRKGWRS